MDALRPGSVPSRPAASAEPPPVGTDERALVAAVLRKDRKATAQFVAAHIDAVYAYTRHRLTPRADLVDDVVQDVFLAALNGLAAFQGQSSLRTWLIAIARHKIEDLYRLQLRSSVAFDDLDVVDEQLLSETTRIVRVLIAVSSAMTDWSSRRTVALRSSTPLFPSLLPSSQTARHSPFDHPRSRTS